MLVAVAPADALLDPLRIPRQIVIHHHGAKLKVDPFRCGLGRYHDASRLAEIFNERGAHGGH